MRYRIGLDVGTASLGVAAFSLDLNNNLIDLIWKHVRIFNEPLENNKGTLVSKKAGCRAARMQRRQIDRRLGRTKHIAALAPLLAIQLEPSADSGRTLLEARSKAARQQISLSDLIRVFIRIGKRRGYAGEFRPKKEGAELGEVEGGNNDLKIEMKALAEAKGLENVTLGEFLYQRWLDNKPTKLKIKESGDKITEGKNLYALRSQLEAEFEQIWQAQSSFHPALNSQHQGKSLKEIFHNAIFFQRPLKAVGGMVGLCALEKNTLPRAPRAQLAFQRFRIEKTLADLRWGAGKRAEKLTAEQKAVIRILCDEKEVVKFEEIYKALEIAACPKPETKGLNLEGLSRDEIPGNKTSQVFRKLGLDQAWLALNERTQIQAINFLADLGSPEQLDDPVWYTRFVRSVRTDNKNNKGEWIYRDVPRVFEPPFIDFINQLKSHDKFDRLSKMGFEGGRASYSIKALKKLTEWLDFPNWPDDWDDKIDGDKNIDEDGAIRVCYRDQLKKQRSISLLDKLDGPPATGNAVVDGSLRQIRYVINCMIQDLGGIPEECVIEFSRDMGVGVTRRNEREKAINDNRLAKKDAIKEIKKSCPDLTVTKVREFRYSLYREQNTKCPYCGQTITLAHAMDGGATEIDHIIPKNITQIGRKRSEVVLVHSVCNQEKKKQSPWEAWGNTERWSYIKDASNLFLAKAIKLKSSIDAAHREGKPASHVGDMHIYFRKAKLLVTQDYENDESVDGFADRQLQATSWIAKEVAKWLQSVCKTPISVSRGQLTAMQRRGWGLDSVISEVRFEENLPVLDQGGELDDNGKLMPAKPISKEDFAKLKKYIDGHSVSREDRKADPHFDFTRRPEKRLDHRHHLIDAITIALTSRELFRQMAINYKAESERQLDDTEPRIKVGKPPLKNVRELALAAIKECPLSIKPDHYPDGAIFKGTAYGVAHRDGEDRGVLTERIAVADLGKKDGKTTEKSARDAIGKIISKSIREKVLEAFEAGISKESATPQGVLQLPIYQANYGKEMAIKKVRCFTGNYADDVMIISHTSKDGRKHLKRLVNGGYAYLEAEISEGQLVGQPNLVKIQQAMKFKKVPKKEGIVRFYKGDTVLDVKDGKKYKIGMFKAASGFFLVPITDPRAYNAIEESNSGKKSVSFSQVARLKLI